MIKSVRFRLTSWYTVVLAFVLVALAAGCYLLFRQSIAQRTDATLAELADAFLTTLQAELQDENRTDTVKTAAQEAIIEHRFREYRFAVLDAQNGLVAASPVDSSPGELPGEDWIQKALSAAPGGGKSFMTGRTGKFAYRALVRNFVVNHQAFTLVAAQSLHRQQELLKEIAQAFLVTIPIALLLAGAGGYFLARKSLAPVVSMSEQAHRIGAENLHERLLVRNEKDELGQLALSFNQLLHRLDQSFEQQRRFMADASHELRTPVAILRGEAEVALSQKARSAEEYRESLTVLHGESQRLTRIVEDLFTLARADAGEYTPSFADLYLEEVVAECVHSVRTLAQAKQISLTFEPADESQVHGDEALLRRLIFNLLDNAIKYTPAGGAIRIELRRADGEYCLFVTDSGPGVPRDLQPRIFERFFRADAARSRTETDGGGAGLGLAISRWIAELHRGRLELKHSDARGSTFAAYFPAPAVARPVSD